ncbi:MAG: RNA polymerase sigma factor [Planctomycetota bacterium]
MNALLARPSLADQADDDLMQMIHAGAADLALPVLERRYGREVRRLVHSIVREPSLASDVAAEAFEKIWLERTHYEPGTNFRAWLLGVTRNHALTALRSLRRAVRVGAAAWGSVEDGGVDVLAQRANTNDDGVVEGELSQALKAAVAELPDRYRTVFQMCVQQQRPYSEVSRTLHLPKGTVAIRIRRARQRLFGALAHRLERDHVQALASHYATCA